MATVTTTIPTLLRYVPYDGLPEAQRRRTFVPRGEVQAWCGSGEVIPAPGVGNNQRAIWTVSLDEAFAYVLCDLVVAFSATGGGGYYWGDVLDVAVGDGSAGARTMRYDIQLVAQGAINLNGERQRVYSPADLPTIMLRAVPDEQAFIQMSAYNTTANDNEYDILTCFARFLQFDVDQSYQWQANAPLPVR